MSTYFYFECLSHTPPLLSAGEVSQHDDVHVENAIRMAQGLPVLDPWSGNALFERNAQQFLAAHPRCAIDIVSEYGDHRPIPGREIADLAKHDTDGAA